MFRTGLQILLVVAVVVGVGLAPAFAQSPLTDRDVAAAIEAGERKRHAPLLAVCRAEPGSGAIIASNLIGGVHNSGGYTVSLSGAAGRIALMAMEARRLYKPIAASDVTADMRLPGMFLTVSPDPPTRTSLLGMTVSLPIETLVIKARGDEILHPTQVTYQPVIWNNLAGGSIESSTAVATFSRDAFRALPDGDVTIVLVTPGGERTCQVDRVDRQRVTNVVATRSR